MKSKFIGNIKNEAGFTLIEALVVMAIIFVLTSILVPGYRNFQYQFALLRSAYKLSHDLRRAQEMAVSAREVEGDVPPGYGLELGSSSTSYILYADINGDQVYQQLQDVVIETIQIERGIFIHSVVPSIPLSVNFEGPDPITRITPDGISDFDSGIFTLAIETNPSVIQTVIVNKAGLIYVQ